MIYDIICSENFQSNVSIYHRTTLFLRFISPFQGTGVWQANFGFSCQNPCPEPYNLNKKKYVIVRHEWETGFELLIKFTPVIDLNDWTMVFTFLDEPGVNVQFHAWEAQVTVSGEVHKVKLLKNISKSYHLF